MRYVTVLIGTECLGPTIICDSYDEAIEQAVQLAADEGYAFTNEDSLSMYDNGVTFPNGVRIEIGGLESPRECQ
tara:strand:+ start:696 stop:917 length:222 start_codon:yes stop_codon:yes gene_type:complete